MDFCWIDGPSVLGGDNPTIWHLKGLYRIGFRTIIFLTDKMEQIPDYNVEAVKAIGFEHFPIFIRDFSAPSVEDFEVVLTTVNWALGQGKVFIHCQYGLGGTGIMGAAYWVDKGSSVEEALEKIRQSNPGAIGVVEQEKSLCKLREFIESRAHMGESPSSWLKQRFPPSNPGPENPIF
jgi:protein-tyrosine phosphatase